MRPINAVFTCAHVRLVHLFMKIEELRKDHVHNLHDHTSYNFKRFCPSDWLPVFHLSPSLIALGTQVKLKLQHRLLFSCMSSSH